MLLMRRLRIAFVAALALFAHVCAYATVGVHATASNSSAATSVTTSAVTTTAGSAVVIFGIVISDDFAATPVQDSKSNTWTEIQSLQDSGGHHTRAWYSKLTSAGSGHTFTININTAAYGLIFAIEVTNPATTPTVLGDRLSDDTTPFATTTGVAPSTAVQLFGMGSCDVFAGADTHTWGGSFVSGDKLDAQTDADNFVTGSVATTTKAAGTYNSSFTTTAAGPCAVWVVSLQTAAGGGASGLLLKRRRN